MEELYKMVGAKFLTDARFMVQVGISLEMFSPKNNVPKEYIIERLHRDMITNISNEIFKKFQKEIKVETVENYQEQHTLEFFAFPKSAFKLIVEYIISEMHADEILKIRNK